MSNIITGFKDNYGNDLGSKLVSKDYLLEVYPELASNIITPELWVWGLNSSNQLGSNDIISRSTPVTTFSGGTNWKKVAIGETMTGAIKNDGSLWVWGNNAGGKLGVNDIINRPTPVPIFGGGNNWKEIYMVGDFSVAIKTDGSLWTWGVNADNQLGVNDSINRQTPVTTFVGGFDWKKAYCANYHVIAIKENGTLWTWGANAQGQLGLGDINSRSTPTQVGTGTDWKECDAGTGVNGSLSAAIKVDGSLWTWGASAQGGLGINTTATNRLTPVTIIGSSLGWSKVSVGGNNCAAIRKDGTMWGWGNNGVGQLGINDTINRLTPVQVFGGGNNWKKLVATAATYGIKTDGSLWVWGDNASGKLGTNDIINRLTPVTTFLGGYLWKDVDARSDGCIAIRSSDII